jgi:hypothetical protein
MTDQERELLIVLRGEIIQLQQQVEYLRGVLECVPELPQAAAVGPQLVVAMKADPDA